MVMVVISRKVSTKNILRKLLYADDLAVVMESKHELQEVYVVEWKDICERNGLHVTLDKTELLSVGLQLQDLGITF